MIPSLLFSHVWAAEVQLQPTLGVAQYYSDNVGLAPAGQETSDWVTQVRPGLNFSYNGAKLRYHATVSAEMLYRANEGVTETHWYFNGGTIGSLELVPATLFIDTDSNASQQNTSVLASQPLNNINTTNNRSTVWYTRVSPYLKYNFGTEASSLVRYTYNTVKSDIPAARGADSGSNRIDAQLTSGPGYRLTTWNLAYDYETVNYTDARDTTAQHITAGVQRLITPVLSLLANVGYEDNNYISTGANPQGTFWNAGVNWTPTPRTRFTATTGERFYGKTHSLDFSHYTRLTVWTVTYSETITSYRQEVLAQRQADTATYLNTLYVSRIPDPVARQQAVQQFISDNALPATMIVPVNFFTNEVFLQKAWRAAVGLQGPRHTFFVNFFTTNSESQSLGLPGATGDFNSTNVVKQTGAGLIWNWRIAAQDSANASVGNSRTETPGLTRHDDYRYLLVAYNHQFTPKMSGLLNYHRVKGSSSVGGADYIENQVWANLQMSF